MFIYELSSGGTRRTGGAKQLSGLWVTRDVATMAWKVKLAVGFAFWLVSCVTGVWSDRDYSLSRTRRAQFEQLTILCEVQRVECQMSIAPINWYRLIYQTKFTYLAIITYVYGICHHHFGLMDGGLIGQWVSEIIDISANITDVAWVNQAEWNISIECRI